MEIKHFKGYIEGHDITDIPEQYLAYPSKNVLVHKGRVSTRLGLTLKGAEGSVNKQTRGWTWKDAKSGELPLRSYDTKWQVWYNDQWLTIFDGLSNHYLSYATWIDNNTDPQLVKKRLFAVDGSDQFLDWNGGIAIVKSVSGNDVEIEGSTAIRGLGFEKADVSNETIVISGTDYVRDDDGTTTTMHLTSAPSGVSAGDVVFAKPIQSDGGLNGFDKDLIFTFKNHLAVCNFNSPVIYFSNSENKLDYTIPTPASRTAITAFTLNLDGNVTAMIDRKDLLWISTVDKWFKVKKLNDKNAYDLFVEIEKVEGSSKNGALPRAVANLKEDTLFVSQNKTVERITDLEIITTDRFKLMSDDVEDLFLRLNLTDMEIHYSERYIYFTVPAEGILLMYDNVEGFWQPPQYIGVASIVNIDGEKVAHSSTRDESYSLFKGDDDAGVPFNATIALGYTDFGTEFKQKKYDLFGVSGRISTDTNVNVTLQHETDGDRAETKFDIDGGKVVTYKASDDDSLGSHPFATRSWAGADMTVENLNRLFAFKKVNIGAFFEHRPILEITGDNIKFQLLSMSYNTRLADRVIPSNLFIPSE